MKLNDIKPANGARPSRKRVGRGPGSGLGKTCGRGVKGQKARSGGFSKTGFEGGQMPLQRRVPKRGFRSRKGLVTEQIRLDALNRVEAETIDLDALRAAGLVNASTRFVKIFQGGEISKAVTLKGLRISAGARAALEAAGGKVEE